MDPLIYDGGGAAIVLMRAGKANAAPLGEARPIKGASACAWLARPAREKFARRATLETTSTRKAADSAKTRRRHHPLVMSFSRRRPVVVVVWM
jgi:hypothetical protein